MSLHASGRAEEGRIDVQQLVAVLDRAAALLNYRDRSGSACAPADVDSVRVAFELLRGSAARTILTAVRVPEDVDESRAGVGERYALLLRWLERRLALSEGKEERRLAAFEDALGAAELGWLYNEMAVMSLMLGRPAEAIGPLRAASRFINRASGPVQHLRDRVALNLAHAWIDHGYPESARAALAPLSRAHAHGDEAAALTQMYVGWAAWLSGRYAEAEQELGMAVLRLSPERPRAFAFTLLAFADFRRTVAPGGPEALALVEQAGEVAAKSRNEDIRVKAMIRRAALCANRPEQARPEILDELDAASRYASVMHGRGITCEVAITRAGVLLRLGKLKEAAESAAIGLELASIADTTIMKVRAMLELARIYKQDGREAAARGLAKTATAVAASCGYVNGSQEARDLV